jgi:glycosyltransferase involved in cell wall biosynthesis
MAYGKSPYTTAAYLEKAFKGLGHDVTIMDLDTLWRARERKLRRMVYREPQKTCWIDATRWLRAHRLKPDLFLWVESPREVEVLVRKGFPCPTASWAIDTNVEKDRLIPLSRQYDHPFVSQKEGTEFFKASGIEAEWLPLAADPDLHRPHSVPVEFEIGFVGNTSSRRYEERVRVLRELSKKYRLHCPNAYGEQMAIEYSRCSLGFNMGLSGGLNMRVFELMAIGRCLITDLAASGVHDLFTEGKHMHGYRSEQEMFEKIDSALANPTRATEMAAAAREEVLAKHTYRHRAQKIVESCLG